MEEENKQVVELKAKIYDLRESMESMNSLLSAVVEASGMDTEEQITPSDVIDRIKFLASLEDNTKSKKKKD